MGLWQKFWRQLGAPQVAVIVALLVAMIGGGFALRDRFQPEAQPGIEVSMTLEDELTTWYPADREYLAQVPVQIDKTLPAYYGSQDAQLLVAGLWTGNIMANIDPLRGLSLQRDLFRLVGMLADAREGYRAGEDKTEFLDEAWNVFPEERSMGADSVALRKFLRYLSLLSKLAGRSRDGC